MSGRSWDLVEEGLTLPPAVFILPPPTRACAREP
jgi:hypothetical protein